MNVEIGTVAAQFLFWAYLFIIFGIGSLQCIGIAQSWPVFTSKFVLFVHRANMFQIQQVFFLMDSYCSVLTLRFSICFFSPPRNLYYSLNNPPPPPPPPQPSIVMDCNPCNAVSGCIQGSVSAVTVSSLLPWVHDKSASDIPPSPPPRGCSCYSPLTAWPLLYKLY
jgi:hypothetical protein